MRQPEASGIDQPPHVSQAGSVRESTQLFVGLSAFFAALVVLLLFVRLDPSPGAFPIRPDVDLGRFSERLRLAASSTEPHIGWLLGITVAFLAGSFVATLTRHSWVDGDRAAQRVGMFSVSISAITSPFVLLLIAGSFFDEALLPVGLMSAFTFFVVVLLALYVGRFASMTLDERLARLDSDIEQARSSGRALSSPGRWWISAVVSIVSTVAVSSVSVVTVLVFMGIRLEIADASLVALLMAAYAATITLLAFPFAVGVHVVRDLTTRILLASTSLGAAIATVLVVWLTVDDARRWVTIALTIAFGVPVLSAALPRRLAPSHLTIAGAARKTAAVLVERRLRRLVKERDRLLRQHSPLVAK